MVKEKKMVKFTETEKKVLLDFLDDLNERFGNDGCNDWEVKNTPENKELVEKAIRFCFKGKDCAEELQIFYEQKDDKNIIFTNGIILDYLTDKLKKVI